MRLNRRPESGSIVIVTERRLFPAHQGNRARIIQLIRSLRWLGFRVILISRDIPRWDVRLRTRWLVDALVTVEADGFSGGHPEAYDCSAFLPAVAEAVHRFAPRAVIAEYLWMIPCLAVVPRGIPTMVDTHDLMHVRGQLYGAAEQGAWVDCSREDEARILSGAEVIIAIQDNEREQFRALAPGQSVICVPHYCDLVVPRKSRRSDQDLIMFVGSGNAANVQGLAAFLETAWPRVRERRPHAELRVFGNVAKRLWPGHPGVTLIGPVRRLEGAYREAKVVINPATVGTGLKIKTVEALARGRAVVTTSVGSDGLEDGRGQAYVLEDEMERFGAAVAELLTNDAARCALEESAHAYAQRRFSREATLQEFLGVVHHRKLHKDLKRDLAPVQP